MKSLMSLCQHVLSELGGWCHVSTTRDWETISRRVEHEGLSFLTIALPQFCKDLDNALALQRVSSDHFVGFARSGGLPRFLGGFLRTVFDARSGVLLDDYCEDSVYAMRQITSLFAKIEIPCSPHRVKLAMRKFVEVDQEVGAQDIPSDFQDRMAMLLVRLFRDSIYELDRRCEKLELVPKHGPGATADRLRGNQKWCQKEWPSRSERSFPSDVYLSPNYRYAEEVLRQVTFLEPGSERPVKVTPVPKTLKTPRLIAIEPTCMQYMQQALLSAFVEVTEADPRLRDFLGLTDQVVNQKLALEGSISGNYSTIDLSEASDRVSNDLVKRVFRRVPHLCDALQDSRSTRAHVPGHGVIPLSKFASMGSATCFPVEATIFLLAVLAGYEVDLGRPLSQGEIDSLRGQVRVFGDDIIVPKHMTDSALWALRLIGAVPNPRKTFTVGNFRESCGKEYFFGLDVTTVKVRDLFPRSRADAKQMASLVSLRNQLYWRGLWQTTSWLDKVIKGFIPFPIVESTSPALARSSALPARGERDCSFLHRPLVRAARCVGRIPPSVLDGVGALLKCLASPGVSSVDARHLSQSGRPLSVNIKIGWTPIR